MQTIRAITWDIILGGSKAVECFDYEIFTTHVLLESDAPSFKNFWLAKVFDIEKWHDI